MRRRTAWTLAVPVGLALVVLTLAGVPVLHAKKIPPAKPININTASAEELQKIPGIGPVTAEKILQMRKASGPFKSVDDLRAIKGIGPKRLAKWRPYLTVETPAQPKKTQSPASKPPPAAEKLPRKP